MNQGLAWKSLLVMLGVYLLFAMVFLDLLPNSQGLIDDLNTLSKRMLFKSRGPVEPSQRLKVVGITENTIAAFTDIGVYYPFPRDWHGIALRRLADSGAKVVVLDILFSEADSWDVSEDEALRDAIIYAQGKGCIVILACAIERQEYKPGVYSDSLLLPAPTILEANAPLGLSNALQKLSFKFVDFVELNIPLGEQEDQVYYSQAVEALKAVCSQDGRDFEKVLDKATETNTNYETGDQQRFFSINYFAKPEQFDGHVYSYESLFLGELNGGPKGIIPKENSKRLRGVFKDSVVFIGSRNRLDNDYFNTPFGLMFGVDTNAQAFDTLDRGRFIRMMTPVEVLALVFCLMLLAWWIALQRPILFSSLKAAGVVVGLYFLTTYLFKLAAIDLSYASTQIGFAFPFVVCMIYGGVSEEIAKRKIRDTFSKYVSEEIVTQIIDQPELADLGGTERRVAVLFCDIRSYSTITENLAPAEIVGMLNIFLGEMTNLIRSHRGFVDKYMGDGLMACFGGPVPTEDPAGDAISAAVEMVKALHTTVANQLKEGGYPKFKAGIGIHFGDVVMGNIGSEHRMDYTVIGDAVNVAARVESQTKEFGWAVIVTQEALSAAQGDFEAVFLGERPVKGRQQPVKMFRVVDPKEENLFKL